VADQHQGGVGEIVFQHGQWLAQRPDGGKAEGGER
jgi:hypothetical protein